MNPEGKKTPNTSSSMDERIKEAIEEQDRTKASQTTAGQTQPTTSEQTLTPKQQQLKAKLAALKAAPAQPQQNQTSAFLPGETPDQFEKRMITQGMSQSQLAKFKQSSPHLFPPNQTPKPPSASSSGPSPS